MKTVILLNLYFKLNYKIFIKLNCTLLYKLLYNFFKMKLKMF